jgi:hypothetical protein
MAAPETLFPYLLSRATHPSTHILLASSQHIPADSLLPSASNPRTQTSHRGWTTRTVDCTYAVADGPEGLKAALQRVCLEADAAVKDKCSLLVLSDRAMGPDRVAIPRYPFSLDL